MQQRRETEDIDVDDPVHKQFRASVESLVEEWRHRVIDLREPLDPVIELRYLPEHALDQAVG